MPKEHYLPEILEKDDVRGNSDENCWCANRSAGLGIGAGDQSDHPLCDFSVDPCTDF